MVIKGGCTIAGWWKTPHRSILFSPRARCRQDGTYRKKRVIHIKEGFFFEKSADGRCNSQDRAGERALSPGRRKGSS